MGFKAKLSIDGVDGVKERAILHCSYAFHRDVDPTGRPSSEVRGGTIRLEIESTEKVGLLEWMANSPHQTKKGSIKFPKSQEDATMKELQFEEGYIVEYSEAFDSVGGNPMVENFVISARKLKLQDAEHVNDWPESHKV